MKRSRIVLLVSVSLGLLLALLCAISGRSESTLAAPPSDYVFSNPLWDGNLLSYQAAITCTLATTTTDGLGKYNGDADNAATLANYSGLALAPGNAGDKILSVEDWFVLNNAVAGSTYIVEALPDDTHNYTLGIIVYSDKGVTEVMKDEDTKDYKAEITLVADSAGPYYFKVYQISDQCDGGTYHLSFSSTASADAWDGYEPNNDLNTPSNVSIGTTLENLNFWPHNASTEEEAEVATPDIDVFRVWCKSGHTYRAETSVTSGVDTKIILYTDSDSQVAENDDYGGTLGSRVTWTPSSDGHYKIKIENLDESPRQSTGQTYNLILTDVTATPTPDPTAGPSPTPSPGPTPSSGIDACEDNSDFDHACVIAADKSYTFNFVPPFGGTDNDYFKIWIKPGFIFECATSDLSPGVDPNMIIYDQNRNGIAGNDDVTPGDYNSALSYYASYDGWLYVLVGTGNRTPSDISNSNYTLLCQRKTPGQDNTPTPTPTPGSPDATPVPTSPPAATAPAQNLTVRPMTTPTPHSGPAATPAPSFIPINLLVYYDSNDDHQPGAGEGIAGISAQAYEAATNQLLAQGFTDEQGNLTFTVSAQGPARVSIPFFGFSQLVAGEEGASIYLRIPPQTLPEETP